MSRPPPRTPPFAEATEAPAEQPQQPGQAARCGACGGPVTGTEAKCPHCGEPFDEPMEIVSKSLGSGSKVVPLVHKERFEMVADGWKQIDSTKNLAEIPGDAFWLQQVHEEGAEFVRTKTNGKHIVWGRKKKQ